MHVTTVRSARRLAMALILVGTLGSGICLGAQESSTPPTLISNDELRVVCLNVSSWTAAAVELRKKSDRMAPEDFVKQADALRKQLERVSLNIAGTRPPAGDQLAAMVLAMATKGAELALWHYIYGAMAHSPASTQYGDTLIKTASSQVENAKLYFQKPNGAS